MASQGYRRLHGIRTPLPGSVALGGADPNETVDVTIYLKSQGADELKKKAQAVANQQPSSRKHLSRAEFASAHATSSELIQDVKEFASWHELTVVSANPVTRTVQLRGTLAAMSAAFDTKVGMFQHAGAEYRARTQPLHVPAAWGDRVEAVLGFDTRPHARPHFRVTRGATHHEADSGFSPTQLAKLYDFPDTTPDGKALDGTGQVIGIIELSSPHGSGYRLRELKKYFKQLGLTPPRVIAVSVDGGMNQPGHDPNDPKNADGEVMLDIEVVGAVAPGATIVVYFAPNTGRGFVDVISAAVHDSVHNPSVISLSWGGAEDAEDPANAQIDQILTAAASMGITFCAASGDSGSRDNPEDPDHAYVDFPASHPYVLACGGTRIDVQGDQIVGEVVWEDCSGGGVSRLWPLPDYQKDARVPKAKNPDGPQMRGVPDVSADADPATGYDILVDGVAMTIGGTSAVAPLFAGLVARINQRLGRAVGFINPSLYKSPQAFNDVTGGSNGDYDAQKGWDACTGLGSPKGKGVLAALS